MSKVANVLSMLQILSNHQKYTIKELSERLEVSERMIRSYKNDLEQAGIYVESIKGPYGGYVLDHNLYLPKVGFSKYDILLLKDIAFYLKANPKFKMHKEYTNLTNKIDMFYKGSKKKVLPLDNDANSKNKYNQISKAIREKVRVKIIFLSLDKNASERIIQPCNLFLYNNDWYASAFCELRGEIRHFALNRINYVEILDNF